MLSTLADGKLPPTDHRTFFHLLSHQHNYPAIAMSSRVGFRFVNNARFAFPASAPFAGRVPRAPLASSESRCCRNQQEAPASMEQPCWYEDCPLLVELQLSYVFCVLPHELIRFCSAEPDNGTTAPIYSFDAFHIELPLPNTRGRILKAFHVPARHRG